MLDATGLPRGFAVRCNIVGIYRINWSTRPYRGTKDLYNIQEKQAFKIFT